MLFFPLLSTFLPTGTVRRVRGVRFMVGRDRLCRLPRCSLTTGVVRGGRVCRELLSLNFVVFWGINFHDSEKMQPTNSNPRRWT